MKDKNPLKCGHSANGFGLHVCKLKGVPCKQVKQCPLSLAEERKEDTSHEQSPD